MMTIVFRMRSNLVDNFDEWNMVLFKPFTIVSENDIVSSQVFQHLLCFDRKQRRREQKKKREE